MLQIVISCIEMNKFNRFSKIFLRWRSDIQSACANSCSLF